MASPKEEGEQANCPFLVTYTTFSKQDNGATTKQLLLWNTKEAGEAGFAGGNYAANSYPIGTYHLSELARAYEEVNPATGRAYDIVNNNCASYMIDLAQALNVKIDSRVTSFVVRRLVEESSDSFLNMLRSRFNNGWSLTSLWSSFKSFFEETSHDKVTKSDSELIQKLVNNQSYKIMEPEKVPY